MSGDDVHDDDMRRFRISDEDAEAILSGRAPAQGDLSSVADAVAGMRESLARPAPPASAAVSAFMAGHVSTDKGDLAATPASNVPGSAPAQTAGLPKRRRSMKQLPEAALARLGQLGLAAKAGLAAIVLTAAGAGAVGSGVVSLGGDDPSLDQVELAEACEEEQLDDALEFESEFESELESETDDETEADDESETEDETESEDECDEAEGEDDVETDDSDDDLDAESDDEDNEVETDDEESDDGREAGGDDLEAESDDEDDEVDTDDEDTDAGLESDGDEGPESEDTDEEIESESNETGDVEDDEVESESVEDDDVESESVEDETDDDTDDEASNDGEDS